MSRLTEREMEEIRRVKRAVENEAREEFSQVRLADDADTRHAAPGLLAKLAQYSGLAELAWMLRNEVILPLRQHVHNRRAMVELHGLNDRALLDIGLCRGDIETAVKSSKVEAPKSPRPQRGPIAALRRWLARRRTIDTLIALDDRMLEDIGIVRAHIPTFVRTLDAAVLLGRIEAQTAAQKLRGHKAEPEAEEVSTLSRQAAGDISRLAKSGIADLGYVTGHAQATEANEHRAHVA